jgi:hypothetical protein
MRTLVITLCLAGLAAPLFAQSGPNAPPPSRVLSLDGPRFGMTFLGDGVVQKLAEKDITVSSAVTQFGWQWEKQFYSKGQGLTAVTEWVALLGGLEQGVVLPSFSWLVGLRTSQGVELGVGPNFTPAGVGLVIAGGVTIRAGSFNVPLNLAVVPSKAGVRVSVLSGFTLRR